MSIRRQILLLPVAVSLLACVLMALGAMYIGRQMDHVTRGRELQLAEERVRSALDTMLDEALARAEMVAALPEVQAAVAARDDKALEAAFGPAWKAIQAQTGAVQMQFHIPPATSLLRVHNLAKRGDDLSAFRKLVVDANREGKSLAGFEAGKAGLGARGVAVVRQGGKPVGTVEIGLDLDEGYLNRLAATTGYDFEFYQVAEGAATRLSASFKGVDPIAPKILSEAARGEKQDLTEMLGEARHMVRVLPIRDHSGAVVALISVAVPTAIYDGLAMTNTLLTAAMTGIAMLVAALIAYLFGRQIVTRLSRLTKTTVALAREGAGVEISDTTRRDEIGDMARALEVFSANLAETARVQAALREEEQNARRAEAARRAQEEAAREEKARVEAEALEQKRRALVEEQQAEQRRAAEAQAQIELQRQVVSALAEGLAALAEGDLSQALEVALPGEYDLLRQHFNAAVRQLAAALHLIETSARNIDDEAAKLAHAGTTFAQNTERNAAALEETAAALNQLTASVSSAADGAVKARDMAAVARGNAESGVKVVQEAVAAMAQIEISSQAISRITGVIDDIAFQTNLLALNAGVEAARAGEAGRGFAVVASEVRALAQRSSDAAREISELISTSTAQVQGGVRLVGRTGEALAEIVASVRDIFDRLGEIAASATEQASGIAEINSAVNQLDQTTQHTAEMSDQSAGSGRVLAREGSELISVVARFRLEAARNGEAGTGDLNGSQIAAE